MYERRNEFLGEFITNSTIAITKTDVVAVTQGRTTLETAQLKEDPMAPRPPSSLTPAVTLAGAKNLRSVRSKLVFPGLQISNRH